MPQSGYAFKDEFLARLASSQELQQVTMEDYYQYMGQIYYLVKDEETQALLRDDPDMKELMPALSHLLRTSNTTDKNVIKEMKLRWRRACRIQLMVKKSPKLVSQAKFDVWVNFGNAAIEDMIEGWRGRLVTERIKTYKIETGSQPKSWWRRALGM
jgi:hypothetical protein